MIFPHILSYKNEKTAERALLKHPDFKKINFKRKLPTGDKCAFFYKGDRTDVIAELVSRQTLKSGLGDLLVELEEMRLMTRKNTKGIVIIFRKEDERNWVNTHLAALIASRYVKEVFILGVHKSNGGDDYGLISLKNYDKRIKADTKAANDLNKGEK